MFWRTEIIAYYNEHDPKAAAWLRELIKQGHIADGDVDERSIEDVEPNGLAGYTQCHFFAGIGVWSYALRRAGWPDDKPVWTGSCPCQPFSAAGKGGGTTDERHLWPAFHHLIAECRPGVIFGEQVEAAIGHGWLDLVQADLEGIGYAFGAVGIPAAGVGAPHIRQRLWFVADNNKGLEGRGGMPERAAECAFGAGGLVGGLANAAMCGRQSQSNESAASVFREVLQQTRQWQQSSDMGATSGRLGITNGDGRNTRHATAEATRHGHSIEPASRSTESAGPTNGHWRNADWIGCRDGKWRPVEPGTSPLAHGPAARVGRLRGYGNAIVAPVAEAFISAYLSCGW